MRKLWFALLACICAFANAAVYRCPQIYPGKESAAFPLTGASMRWGEQHGDGWLVGDVEAAEEGYDLRYGFPDEEQAWLVCEYGGKKRNKGRFHDGREWNQSMREPVASWWMKLAPKVGRCAVQVRELKGHDPRTSTWTVTAYCENQ